MSTWLISGYEYDTVFGHARSTSTGTNIFLTSENSIRYKPEVENVPQTGNTNNLATETNISAILLLVLLVLGTVSTSGLHLILLSLVGQFRCRERIESGVP